jgi:hypothetical protein
MKNKAKLAYVFGFLLFGSILFTSSVSALESWQRWAIAENALSQSDDYDVIWEGPVFGGTAVVSMRGGNSASALSNFNLNSGNFDVLSYQKNDVVSYGSSGYRPSYRYGGYGGSSPWYQKYWSNPRSNSYRGYGSNSRSYFSDNSESLFIDNRLSNSRPRTNVYVFGDSSKTNNYGSGKWDSDLGYYNWRY